MAEQTINSEHAVPPTPELHRNEPEPKGVLRKNLKVAVYLGAAMVVVLAAVLSSTGKKTGHQSSTKQHEPPQPAIQDNTDNNVQDLKNQLAAERQKEAQTAASVMTQTPNGALTTSTLTQQAASSVYGANGQLATCMPGQPCTSQQNAYVQPQMSPVQQQAEQLAAKERELAYNARFESNLVYARSAESRVESPNSLIARSDAGASQSLEPAAAAQSTSNLVSARQTSEQKGTPVDQPSGKRSAEVNIDAAVGQPYVVYEG